VQWFFFKDIKNSILKQEINSEKDKKIQSLQLTNIKLMDRTQKVYLFVNVVLLVYQFMAIIAA
jgi:hypothetical protein